MKVRLRVLRLLSVRERGASTGVPERIGCAASASGQAECDRRGEREARGVQDGGVGGESKHVAYLRGQK
jgi:hypothetical protein